jgi:hypothetical protein
MSGWHGGPAGSVVGSSADLGDAVFAKQALDKRLLAAIGVTHVVPAP